MSELVERKERGNLTAEQVLLDLANHEPGEVFKFRVEKPKHKAGEAFTYVKVITRQEYDSA